MVRALGSIRGRAGLLLAAALIVVGASACLPDTGPAPTSDAWQLQLFNAINADRVANGVPPLTNGPKLAWLAGTHSCDMAHAGSMYHTDLNATLATPDYKAYWTLGENILVGPGSLSPAQMEAAWMNSPPHRANILSQSFTIVGVGRCVGPDGRIWSTEDFGALR